MKPSRRVLPRTRRTGDRCSRWSIVAFICLALVIGSAAAQVTPREAKKWRADLETLVQELSDRHVDLYHTVSEAEFSKAVADLDGRIPSMTNPEILVGLAQLLAMIGDGHTSFYPGNQKNMWFRFYPIKLWAFADGIYVIGATGEHKNLLGKRLVGIDEASMEQAIAAISTTIAADNDREYLYTVPFELPRPELLHVLGIATSPDRAQFVFEGDLQATLLAIPLKTWQQVEWFSANGLYQGKSPPSMRLEFQFATDLTLEHLKRREYYWFTHLKEEKALFLQYNVSWDQKNRPRFSEIAEEMFRVLDEKDVDRLIVDLRQNSGGEPATASYLIEELEKRKEFTEQGRLFVLVGKRTFSAALTNALQLRKVGAIVVGEPPRGKPNNPSEGRDIVLKRTKIWATVSTEFVERDPSLGDAPYLPVDVPVTYAFRTYQEARDPVLEAALAVKIPARSPEAR